MSLPTLPPVWSAHGLTFAQQDDPNADVLVQFAPVPLALPAPVRSGRRVDIGKGEWLLRLSDDVRICATGGREISVDAPGAAQSALVTAWVQGPATVAILYQRGLAPLHASAVTLGGRIVAFLGPSGMGKSSLAAACLAAGAGFVTDDVLVVAREPKGILRGFPGPTLLRVHPATGESTGWRGLRSLGAGHDGKTLAEPEGEVMLDPAPVGAIFLLGMGDTLATERLYGMALFARLRALLQRPRLAAALGAEGAVFEVLGTLTREVSAWQLVRPASGWTLPECLESIRRVLPEAGISWKASATADEQ